MGAGIASSHHSFTSYSWFERDHRVSRAIEKFLMVSCQILVSALYSNSIFCIRRMIALNF